MLKSESIILSKKPLGEADLLISFFSREKGKLKGVARNAKKSRRRFGGLLETGYVLNLHYKPSNRSELVRIDQASLVAPKAHVSSALPSTTALWLAMELAVRFLPDEEVNKEKYELLNRFVMTIHEKRLTRQILLFFLLRWIRLCGYMPDFSGPEAETCYQFSCGSIDCLQRLLSGDMKTQIDDAVFEDLLKFIFHYSKLILGKPLNLESYVPILMEL